MVTMNIAALAIVDLGVSAHPSYMHVHSSRSMGTRWHCNLERNGKICEAYNLLSALLWANTMSETLF